MFPQLKFQQSSSDSWSKWAQKARAPLSMKRVAHWWFQLNLATLEVDLMEEMVTQVEAVHEVMVEAMVVMENSKTGVEESAVVWI